MVELERALVIGRATYERWLGTEPHEIAAAAAALRELEPQHPRLRKASKLGSERLVVADGFTLDCLCTAKRYLSRLAPSGALGSLISIVLSAFTAFSSSSRGSPTSGSSSKNAGRSVVTSKTVQPSRSGRRS